MPLHQVSLLSVYVSMWDSKAKENTAAREIGLQDLTSNLVIPTFYMNHSLTERKLYSHPAH